MSDTVEQAIAARLRQIAERVRAWENRDVQELLDSGSERLHRPAYFADLESIASMLEGRHPEHRLRRDKPAKGRPGNVANVDRDLAIAQLVDEYRRDPGRKVKDGIAAAADRFGLSEKQVDAAQRRMKYALEPGNEAVVPFFERLAARGLVKITRPKGRNK